jgi:predicted site-specific integrase-resolvase
VINEHTKGGDDMAKTMTPTELALELNVSPKTLRGWLRKHHTRPVNVKNTSWALDAKTCNAARKAFKRDA